MSHVVTVDLEFNDLEALAKAAERIGGELHKGKTSYRSYASGWQDDTPIPEGMFAPEETERLRRASREERRAVMTRAMRECDHEITFPGAAYSVGVVNRPGGKFGIRWDYWGAGGLVKPMGDTKGTKLRQAYGIERAKLEARRKGWRTVETRTATGVRLTVKR